MILRFFFLMMYLLASACMGQTKAPSKTSGVQDKTINLISSETISIDTNYRTIHLFVALCDNKYQGIVPVPSSIGNGQDPVNNLYWGSVYGVKTFFRRSKDWVLVKSFKIGNIKQERIVFKHRTKKTYLIADAYDGRFIKECTLDFLKSSCGQYKDTMRINGKTIGIAGFSTLAAYIGHDGLMDFQLDEKFINYDQKKRDIIILACYSKKFFSPHLENANINPLVWTTGLMAPEAYTVHDALNAYLNNEASEQIRSKAALAYSKYQRCSVKAARNLLVSGW